MRERELLHLSLDLCFSLNLGLDPAEEGLIACHTVALGALLIRRCATYRNIALFLLVCDQ
jgi:hypothetical protein